MYMELATVSLALIHMAMVVLTEATRLPARTVSPPRRGGKREDSGLTTWGHIGLSWFIMVYHGLSWFIMVYHGLF